MTTGEATSNLLELPADLINQDSEGFKQWLLEGLVAGRPLVMSGKHVTRIGAAALQLLVAFRRECAIRDIGFELSAPSRVLLDVLAQTGLSHELGSSAPVA